LSFTVEHGLIDTNSPNFGPFDIWINPCETSNHGYGPNAKFWPQGQLPPSRAVAVPVGKLVHVDLKVMNAHSGRFGLGN